MRIFVRALEGAKFTIDAELADTIGSVKQKVHAVGGPPASRQRLIFCGREIDDSDTVEMSGIQADSCFHLVEVEAVGPAENDEANELKTAFQAALDEAAKAAEAERRAKEENQAALEKTAELQIEVERLQGLLGSARKERDAIAAVAADAKATQAESMQRTRAAEATGREQARMVVDLQQTQSKLLDVQESLKSEAEFLKQRLQDARAEVDAERARHQREQRDLMKRFHAAKGQCAALAQSLTQAQKALSEAQAKSARLEEEVADLSMGLATERSRSSAASAELESLHRDIENMACSASQQEALARQNSKLETKLAAATAQVADLEQLAAQRLERIEIAEAKVAQAELSAADQIALVKEQAAVADEKAALALQQVASADKKVAAAEAEAALAAEKAAEAAARESQAIADASAVEKRLAEVLREAEKEKEKVAATVGCTEPMDAELAAVQMALNRYNAKQAKLRRDAEERVAQAVAAEAAATKTAEQQAAETSALQRKADRLAAEMGQLYSRLGNILPADRQARVPSCPRPGLELHARVNSLQLSALVQAGTQARPAPEPQAQAEEQAEAQEIGDAVPAVGVGAEIQFLRGKCDVVRVVEEHPRFWRLESGRIAKKKTMGRVWVWRSQAQAAAARGSLFNTASPMKNFVDACKDMGFRACQARRAYQAHNGNTEAALDFLMTLARH